MEVRFFPGAPEEESPSGHGNGFENHDFSKSRGFESHLLRHRARMVERASILAWSLYSFLLKGELEKHSLITTSSIRPSLRAFPKAMASNLLLWSLSWFMFIVILLVAGKYAKRGG